MSQRRMVHSKIWTSEQVGKLSKVARLLYVGTITLSDDEGRLKGNTSYLRSQIFPYDDEIKVSEISQWLDEILKVGLLISYEANGYHYLKHPNWEDYQKIRADMFKPSTLPDIEAIQTRNGTVTESVRKRTISKDKLSKVKLSKDKLIEYKKDILAVWNVKGIIVHKSLSKDASKEIDKLFGYPANLIENPEQVTVSIIETISVYAKVLDGAEYWWSHKWNLYEFLKRGYKQFEGKSPSDYLKGRGGGKTDKI